MLLSVSADPLADYFEKLYVEQSSDVLRKLDDKRLDFLLTQVEYIDIFVLNDDLSGDTDRRFFLELERVYTGYNTRKRLRGEEKDDATNLLRLLFRPGDDTSIDSFNPAVGLRLFSRQHVLLMEASASKGPSSATKGRIGDALFSIDGIVPKHVDALIRLAKVEPQTK